MSEKTRYIPAGVRRQLRQEVAFGCPVCGNPFLEYHHIVPWAEKQHNDPDHMVALCPTHHAEYGKRPRSDSYELKQSPINANTGKIRGYLVSDEERSEFIAGSNTFIDTPIIFSYYGIPILKYVVEDGRNLLSAYLPNDDFWPELRINNNDIIANTNSFWDFEFKHNFICIKKRNGSIFFQIDFRKPVAKVSANLTIAGIDFRFTPSETNFGENFIKNGTFISCGTGLSYGGKNTRILLPNYAMNLPQAVLFGR
jgi:hypothetical protein